MYIPYANPPRNNRATIEKQSGYGWGTVRANRDVQLVMMENDEVAIVLLSGWQLALGI